MASTTTMRKFALVGSGEAYPRANRLLLVEKAAGGRFLGWRLLAAGGEWRPAGGYGAHAAVGGVWGQAIAALHKPTCEFTTPGLDALVEVRVKAPDIRRLAELAHAAATGDRVPLRCRSPWSGVVTSVTTSKGRLALQMGDRLVWFPREWVPQVQPGVEYSRGAALALPPALAGVADVGDEAPAWLRGLPRAARGAVLDACLQAETPTVEGRGKAFFDRRKRKGRQVAPRGLYVGHATRVDACGMAKVFMAPLNWGPHGHPDELRPSGRRDEFGASRLDVSALELTAPASPNARAMEQTVQAAVTVAMEKLLRKECV